MLVNNSWKTQPDHHLEQQWKIPNAFLCVILFYPALAHNLKHQHRCSGGYIQRFGLPWHGDLHKGIG
jgi:hypothetical protein